MCARGYIMEKAVICMIATDTIGTMMMHRDVLVVMKEQFLTSSSKIMNAVSTYVEFQCATMEHGLAKYLVNWDMIKKTLN